MGDNNLKNELYCAECFSVLKTWNYSMKCTCCRLDICQKCNQKSIRCDNCEDIYCKLCRKNLILKRCMDCGDFKCRDCMFIFGKCCDKRLSRIEEIKRENIMFELETRSGVIM